MIRSTFSSFTTATLALQANQRAMDVIGQNIANINTEGYTRQRLDLVSFNLYNGSYANPTINTNVGYGVKINNLTQLRDPFLDVQYRNQIAKVGTADAKQSTMDLLANIFDETDTEGIKVAIEDLRTSINDMNLNVNSESDTIVRARCQTLINLLSVRGTELGDVREQLTYELENTHIKDVNNLLKEIGELNTSIWNSKVLGNPALELQDQLNVKIDTLSSYLPIQVIYKDRQISSDVTLTYPEISFFGSDGSKIALINGDCGENFAQLEFESTDDNRVSIYLREAGTLDKYGGPLLDKDGNQHKALDITDTLKDGTFQGVIQMLNESADLDNPPTSTRGLGYYEQTFNAFVNTFAQTMNQLNSYIEMDEDGNPVQVPVYDENNNPVFNDDGTPKTQDKIVYQPLFTVAGVEQIGVNDKGEIYDATDPYKTPLEFTATNITINPAWMSSEIGIVTSQTSDSGSTATDNLARFINALDNGSREFKVGDTIYFIGNFSQAYANLENVQGIDSKSNTAALETHISVVQKTMDNRDALSGVSLDEEGVSILQYQRSYSAAARLMTALDELVNVLINSTGLVGR